MRFQSSSWLFLTLGSALMMGGSSRASDLVEENGFRLPEGFGIQLYADDALAHDISCLTLDTQGRVVVSGPGYIKTLIPDEEAPWHAPKAKQAVDFSNTPLSGAQGLCFVGNELFASGDGAVWKFRDADGDGRADGTPEKFIKGVKSGGEHGVHGIVQGPDGWLYVIGGDGSDITERLNSIPTACISDVAGGAILRVSLDGMQREVIAHGFRNPYALCFNSLGSIFAWDSDGERVEHLPGYRPCSLFDVGRGRHHGWVNSTPGNPLSRPWHWPDVVDPVIQVGRGSPTGMVCYRHRQFPEEWQGGVFFACWTLGRLYFCQPERMVEKPRATRGNGFEEAPATPTGPGYTAEKRVFLEPAGNQGFAPTALAVGPDGALYVASGGRGTRGAVYRIAHKTNEIHGDPEEEVEQVIAADQPDAAWSRSQWVERAKALGARPFEEWLRRDSVGLAPLADIRALEILTELFGGVSMETVRHIHTAFAQDAGRKSEGRELLVRLAWAAERHPKLTDKERKAEFLGPAMEAGRQGHRATMEAYMMQHGSLPKSGNSGEAHDDLSAAQREELRRGLSLGDPDNVPLLSMRSLIAAAGEVQPSRRPQWDDGYFIADPTKMRNELLANSDRWMGKGESADYEYARLVAMTRSEPANFWEALPRKWTAESEVAHDLHYLFVAARRGKAHENAGVLAEAWLRLHHKMRQRGQSPSRMWPQMAGEAFAATLERTPALAEAIASSALLTLPEHAMFVERLEPVTRHRAALKLTSSAEEWTPELVKLAAGLIEPYDLSHQAGKDTAAPQADVLREDERAVLLKRLRGLKDHPGLGDLVTPLLFAYDDQGDRIALALRMLGSFDPRTVEQAALFFKALGSADTGTELWIALLGAMGRLEGRPNGAAAFEGARAALAECVRSSIPNGEAVLKANSMAEAESILRALHPGAMPELRPGTSPASVETSARWAKIGQTKGDAARGKVIYEQRQCARCHDGNARLGPDLKGVAQRWAAEDLFLHIEDPNRQISPAWKGELFVLQDGREFTGALVYDSPASMLVQISPDETVRVTGAELKRRATSGISLMPPGLLQGLSDADLADLHAWLQTIK